MSIPETSSRLDPRDPAHSFRGLRESVRESTRPLVEAIFDKWLVPGEELLELGCGTGELYRMIPEAFRASLTALDLSQWEVNEFKARHPEARVARGDARNLPYENSSVPAVVALDLLDIIPDYRRAVREIKRVLRPGGVFIHLHDIRPNMGFLAAELLPDAIPIPHKDPKGGLRNFYTLPAPAYRNGPDNPVLSGYVVELLREPFILETLRTEKREQLDLVEKLAVADFGDRLQETPPFRELFNQALRSAAVESGLRIEELSQNTGSTDMTAEQVATLLAHDPQCPISYESGGIVAMDENGAMSFYPDETSDGPPIFIANLSVAVLRKSSGPRPKRSAVAA